MNFQCISMYVGRSLKVKLLEWIITKVSSILRRSLLLQPLSTLPYFLSFYPFRSSCEMQIRSVYNPEFIYRWWEKQVKFSFFFTLKIYNFYNNWDGFGHRVFHRLHFLLSDKISKIELNLNPNWRKSIFNFNRFNSGVFNFFLKTCQDIELKFGVLIELL